MDSTSPEVQAGSTSVSIWVNVDEGFSNEGARLFANNRAQLPVTIYVSCGSAEVEDVGVVQRKEVQDMYPQDISGEYSLPQYMTDENGEIDRKWKAYPDNHSQSPNTEEWNERFRVYLSASKAFLSGYGEKRVELMAFVQLSNYIPMPGREPETITFFTCMDASNSAGTPFKSNQFITVYAAKKPSISMTVNPVAIPDGPRDGKIYYYYAKTSEAKLPFELHDCVGEMTDKNGTKLPWRSPPFFNPTDPSITEFGFQGRWAGVNKVARAFAHGDWRSGNMRQSLNNGECCYLFQNGEAVASASAFWHKSAQISGNLCDDDWIDNRYRYTVRDKYGGCTRIDLKPDLDAYNGGHGKIEHDFVYIHE